MTLIECAKNIHKVLKVIENSMKAGKYGYSGLI